jgi:hypothetical protein
MRFDAVHLSVVVFWLVAIAAYFGGPLISAIRRPLDKSAKNKQKYLTGLAGVVQWQNGSFPSCIRGFDSLRPLQYLADFP